MFNNPKELPIGFGMSLSMNPDAMDYYAKLSYEQQQRIVNYVQNNNTGLEAKEKIDTAISNLSSGNISFIE